MGIKELKPVAYGKFRQGYYNPIHPEKYVTNTKQIIYRSSWELKFMKWLDISEEVVEWASEPVSIKYFYTVDSRMHTYYPDFYFAFKKQDGSIVKYIVECKPSNQLKEPEPPKRRTVKTIKNYNYLMECCIKNSCKRVAAKKWCEEHGKEVVVIPRTEGISSTMLREYKKK